MIVMLWHLNLHVVYIHNVVKYIMKIMFVYVKCELINHLKLHNIDVNIALCT